jgi:trehalose/maltose hydrolase-like predicted phosphorylase
MDDTQHLQVLVSAPDWTRLRITIDGSEVAPGKANMTRTLDMRRGVLLCSWRFTTDEGTTLTLRTLRSASQDQRALAWHAVRLDVDRPAAIIAQFWLEPLDSLLVRETTEQNRAIWRTVDGAHTLALATVSALDLPDSPIVPLRTDQYSYERWEWQAQPDRPAFYSRLIEVARDEDAALPSAAMGVARHDALRDAQATDYGLLIEAHERAWQERWLEADVVLEGDERLQSALRFALYHLISAANPSDSAVSIGARALTGDAYHGHVFWDTEIFLLPFYTFCWPAAARALLSYRYRTLPAARRKATQMGYRGALYAWESTDTGGEETPDTIVDPTGKAVAVLSGRKEQHISADVAYAVWQYWLVTQDVDFLLTAGAEIILETARFWDSRATHEPDGRFHIRDVIGPDEYHESVDDDAYTNGMAAWNLDCGAKEPVQCHHRPTVARRSLAQSLGRVKRAPDTHPRRVGTMAHCRPWTHAHSRS